MVISTIRSSFLATSTKTIELRRAMHELKDRFHQTKGLLCFSRWWGNPALWSHYADRHRGIALGFVLPDQKAFDVEYSNSRLVAQFNNDDPSQGLDPAFEQKLLLTKSEHWRYEDEVRMIVNLEECVHEDGSYFLGFSADLELRQVVLGPLCPMPKEAVQSLVRALYPSSPIDVLKSRLAFSLFEVIRDDPYGKGGLA